LKSIKKYQSQDKKFIFYPKKVKLKTLLSGCLGKYRKSRPDLSLLGPPKRRQSLAQAKEILT